MQLLTIRALFTKKEVFRKLELPSVECEFAPTAADVPTFSLHLGSARAWTSLQTTSNSSSNSRRRASVLTGGGPRREHLGPLVLEKPIVTIPVKAVNFYPGYVLLNAAAQAAGLERI